MSNISNNRIDVPIILRISAPNSRGAQRLGHIQEVNLSQLDIQHLTRNTFSAARPDHERLTPH